jgi:hypothetical protein
MITVRCNGMVRLCGNIAHDSRFYVGTLGRERGTEHNYLNSWTQDSLSVVLLTLANLIRSRFNLS